MGHPRLAVDGVLLLEERLVTVLRGNPPFRGMHALPGGAVELGETTQAAMIREMQEETGLRTEVVGLVGVYSDPGRDPRGHTVSIAYELHRVGGQFAAGSDAAAVDLLDPTDLPPMAFDHAKIVADFLKTKSATPIVARPAAARPPSPSRGSRPRRRGGRTRVRTGRAPRT